MEYIEDIKLFIQKNRTDIISIFIMILLISYSIMSKNIYLIILSIEIFIFYVIEVIDIV